MEQCEEGNMKTGEEALTKFRAPNSESQMKPGFRNPDQFHRKKRHIFPVKKQLSLANLKSLLGKGIKNF